MRNRLSLIAMAIILSIIAVANTTPASAQVETTVDAPEWLVGKLAGEQKVTSQPTWAPAGLEVEITSTGTGEIYLRTLGGSQTIKGAVLAATADTALFKGRYTMGRNYDKEVVYAFRRQNGNGMVKGVVTAKWITMDIEVTLRQQEATRPTRSEVVASAFSADRALYIACLAEAGIPDRDVGCSHTPQP